MDRISVKSSMIRSVAYDSENKILEVEFTKGESVYSYANVPQEAFDALMAASSPGSHFLTNIKGKYETTKL
jgi:hypothetical protein